MTTGREGPSLRITHRARSLAFRQAREALPMETGGILIGFRAGRALVVTHFEEVHDGDATRRGFTLRAKAAQSALDRHLGLPADGGEGYIGEWHSHPEPVGASHVDLDRLGSLASASSTPIGLAVLMLDSSAAAVGIDAWIGVRRWLRHSRLERAAVLTLDEEAQ